MLNGRPTQQLVRTVTDLLVLLSVTLVRFLVHGGTRGAAHISTTARIGKTILVVNYMQRFTETIIEAPRGNEKLSKTK